MESSAAGGANEEGGWGWLVEDDSNALGTGIALFALGRMGVKAAQPYVDLHRCRVFALGRMGVKAEDKSVQDAVDFLTNSQSNEGSWAVKGTKQAAGNRVTETASYWGTCWVVIGLMEILNNEP